MSVQNQCFFKKNESCTKTLVSLYDLRHTSFSKAVFPGAQSSIEIMLLRNDSFYVTKLRLRKTYVCTKHKEDLSKEYRISKYRNCFICVRGLGKSSASAAVQNITSIVALTVFEQLHLEHSYGMPICRRCREVVLKRGNQVIAFRAVYNLYFVLQVKINEHQIAYRWLENVVFSDEESDETIEEQEYQPSPISAISSISGRSFASTDKNKRALLNSFVQLMRPGHPSCPLLVTRSYNELNEKSKRNFLSSAKFVVEAVVEFLAGDYASQVLRKLYSNESNQLKK